MKQFFQATATLAGLIIGVGIFGVPYVMAQAGFWVGLFWIALLGAVVLIVHLLYGEIVAATPGKHRLPGYVGQALGKEGKRITLAIDIVRFWGLQTAYLIVGGIFFSTLAQRIFPGTPAVYSIFLFILVAGATFFGLRIVNRVEFVLTWLLVGTLFWIAVRGLPHLNPANFFAPGLGGLFRPYGVVLVSLAGAAAIPEIWEVVGRRRQVFQASIIAGTLIAVVVTAIFAAAVVGVTGSATSPEAISGLQSALGARVVWFGALAGFFAIATSYLIVALYLQEALRYDFQVQQVPAWALAVGVPFVLFVAGAQNYIEVIDLVGSVLFGIEGVLIVAVVIAMARRKHLPPRRVQAVVGILAASILVLGVIQKVVGLF